MRKCFRDMGTWRNLFTQAVLNFRCSSRWMISNYLLFKSPAEGKDAPEVSLYFGMCLGYDFFANTPHFMSFCRCTHEKMFCWGSAPFWGFLLLDHFTAWVILLLLWALFLLADRIRNHFSRFVVENLMRLKMLLLFKKTSWNTNFDSFEHVGRKQCCLKKWVCKESNGVNPLFPDVSSLVLQLAHVKHRLLAAVWSDFIRVNVFSMLQRAVEHSE